MNITFLPLFSNYSHSNIRTNSYQHEYSTPAFGARVNKDIFQRVLSFDPESVTQYIKGNVSISTASLDKMKEIHKALQDQPDVIAKMYLTYNGTHDLPIHCADLDKMKEIHRALKDQPDVIAKMHLTHNISYHLPIYIADLDKMKEIHRALQNQPKVIARIHLSRNNRDTNSLRIHKANLEEIKEIHKVLEDQPEVIALMHLARDKYGNLPIDYQRNKKAVNEIHRVIRNIALDSDLDIDRSIELLETYNRDGRYSEAIKNLKEQL